MATALQLLERIAEKSGITAFELATKFYDDSPAWTRAYDGGNDRGMGKLGQQGKGIWLSVGGQVGKLIKKGLVCHAKVNLKRGGYKHKGYEITGKGYEFIEKNKPAPVEVKKEEPVCCPECGSTNVFDLDTKFECDDCQLKFDK